MEQKTIFILKGLPAVWKLWTVLGVFVQMQVCFWILCFQQDFISVETAGDLTDAD